MSKVIISPYNAKSFTVTEHEALPLKFKAGFNVSIGPLIRHETLFASWLVISYVKLSFSTSDEYKAKFTVPCASSFTVCSSIWFKTGASFIAATFMSKVTVLLSNAASLAATLHDENPLKLASGTNSKLEPFTMHPTLLASWFLTSNVKLSFSWSEAYCERLTSPFVSSFNVWFGI